MNVSDESLNELNELLSALCDDRIRDDEFQKLEKLVLADSELRWYYIRFMHVHGSLSRFVQIDTDDLARLSMDVQQRHQKAVAVNGRALKAAPKTATCGVDTIRHRSYRQRIMRFAIAAVIILACFLVVDRLSRHSVSTQAFAAALRQLNTARVISYTAEFKHNGQVVRSSESMHLQPDRVREELPGGMTKVIDFSKRKSIIIDPGRRTAVVFSDTSNPQNYKQERFLDKIKEAIERIRTDPLRTDRYLGERITNGRTLAGFEMRKPTQVQTLWVDVETGLLTEMEIVAADDPGQGVLMRNFRFNVESYESLFSVDPPPGYEVSFETIGPTKPLDEKSKMIPR